MSHLKNKKEFNQYKEQVTFHIKIETKNRIKKEAKKEQKPISLYNRQILNQIQKLQKELKTQLEQKAGKDIKTTRQFLEILNKHKEDLIEKTNNKNKILKKQDFPFKTKTKNINKTVEYFSGTPKITPVAIEKFLKRQNICGSKEVLTDYIDKIYKKLIKKHQYKISRENRHQSRKITADEKRILILPKKMKNK